MDGGLSMLVVALPVDRAPVADSVPPSTRPIATDLTQSEAKTAHAH